MGGWREGRRADKADISGRKKEAVAVVAKFWGGPGMGLLCGGWRGSWVSRCGGSGISGSWMIREKSSSSRTMAGD